MGTPDMRDWPEGHQLAKAMNFKWPQFTATPIAQVVPMASREGVTLISDLLKWNPGKRPTASQSLRYPYFQVGQKLGPSGLNESQTLRAGQLRQSAPVQMAKNNNNKGRPDSGDSFADAFNESIRIKADEKRDGNNMTAKQRYLNNARYVAGQNTKNGGSNAALESSWKGSDLEGFRMKQQQQQMIAAGGSSRTDWAAKYLK
ncbi:unnamed protein product [Notodromas monacha]|uniref:Uncharacterized protein n=1 Tax=Notodromas monacha TaxID=399045 RepID=A0A7R9GIV1_9CRUS|nr:unnamed protein product [Notodromas monacha]CAG0922987.1 unnamed protein product [Notodromas monacha]